MASFLQKVAGKAGKAIDIAGNLTNNFSAVTKGIKLPELGISERLQSWGGQVNPFNPPSTRAAEPEVLGANYSTSPLSQAQLAYQNQQTRPTTSTSYSSGGNSGGGYNDAQNVVNENTTDSLDSINRDYEDNMRMLGDQEKTEMGNAAAASAELGTEETKVKNQIANQQSVDESGQQSVLNQGETNAAEGMRGARDLFRQIQQNNIMQLSGAGLSSSSVAEAMAEKLGVETAKRIAGITGTVQEVRQNVAKELARIKSYYEGKATEVQQWVSQEKVNISNKLAETLRNIGTAKQMAASAKANARADALSQQRTQLFQLAQQENQFQQSLKAWAQQKADATAKIITDPNVIAKMQADVASLNNPGNPTQFSLNYGVGNNGQQQVYAGPYKTTVTKKDDELADPFKT